MYKKRRIIFFCIVTLLILLVPIKIQYKDIIGSVGYKAILYEVITYPPYMGATEGVEVQILGIQVYNNVILPSGLIFVDE